MVITDQVAGRSGAQRITADIGHRHRHRDHRLRPGQRGDPGHQPGRLLHRQPGGLTAYIGLPASRRARPAPAGWRSSPARPSTRTWRRRTPSPRCRRASCPPPPTSAGSNTTVNGQKVYVLTWKATAIGTPDHRPAHPDRHPAGAARQRDADDKREAKTVTFSRWGAPFTVTAPASVIPYTEVSGACSRDQPRPRIRVRIDGMRVR